MLNKIFIIAKKYIETPIRALNTPILAKKPMVGGKPARENNVIPKF